MNTIPTIFNERLTPYTAVGGKERIASNGISAVVLNRHGRYPRRTFFQELEKTGFDNVISIEPSSQHYDLEELTSRFPSVRFVFPERKINIGEQINLAASEIESPLFFVLWNDLKIIAGGTARRMAERLSSSQEEAQGEAGEEGNKKERFKRLCTVPLIMNSRYEILPTLRAPVTRLKKMRTAAMEGHSEGQLSLYPFDGVGIYDRQRFIRMGGFDITLANTHWQFMDFGFRAHLWGEEIALNLQLKLSCDTEIPAEDTTAEKSYRRFYLKNIAPVYRDYYARLPLLSFPHFLFSCGEDFFAAWEEFRECRAWVFRNKSRWKYGLPEVIRLWDGLPEGDNIN